MSLPHQTTGDLITATIWNTQVDAINAVDVNGILPIGSIADYGGSAAPANWKLCDGSAINRTTFAALFAVIGTAYGVGDGVTTFNLPDFRGRAVIGAGTGSGLTARARGDMVGEESHVLTLSELPAFTGWDTTTGDQNVHGGTAGQPSGIGSGAGHNTMQPSGVATKIIRYQ